MKKTILDPIGWMQFTYSKDRIDKMKDLPSSQIWFELMQEYGGYVARKAKKLDGVSDVVKSVCDDCMCPSHKPNLKDSYVQWHDWAESQAEKGIKQTQCEQCKRWLFPSEF